MSDTQMPGRLATVGVHRMPLLFRRQLQQDHRRGVGMPMSELWDSRDVDCIQAVTLLASHCAAGQMDCSRLQGYCSHESLVSN